MKKYLFLLGLLIESSLFLMAQTFSLSDEAANLLLQESPIASFIVADQKFTELFHRVERLDESKRQLVLEDQSVWLVGRSYATEFKKWKKGDRLQVSYHEKYSNNVCFENLERSSTLWGTLEKGSQKPVGDYIARLSHFSLEEKKGETLILQNGAIFKGPGVNWKVRETVFVFHSATQAGRYDLWNVGRDELVRGWKLVGDENQGSSESILNLEKALNRQVLGQEEAIAKVAGRLLNAWIGLNDPQMPIGVFLFLGPSGVGKTELAKVLAEKLFRNRENIVRFDMSNFVEDVSITRLIGSPPGYVNHEEGGQLTEALRAKPRSIVLLDEMEKAHPRVRKLFLPLFDEGYIVDSKNRKIKCDKTLFILTSNLFSEEINTLFKCGLSMEEVIEKVEPLVINELSPELYNRVIPAAFRPLSPKVMDDLVDLLLEEARRRLQAREMTLIVGSGVKDYLKENGFHPSLGARPLKKLIQEKIMKLISYTIIQESIPEGSTLILSYENEEWSIEWFENSFTNVDQ